MNNPVHPFAHKFLLNFNIKCKVLLYVSRANLYLELSHHRQNISLEAINGSDSFDAGGLGGLSDHLLLGEPLHVAEGHGADCTEGYKDTELHAEGSVRGVEETAGCCEWLK